MFTALILACTVEYTQCQTFMAPMLFPDEEMCMQALGGGIMVVEQQGLFVQDYKCVQWGTDT
jgi:hypothetical protein